jgi:hypothetical protein
MSRKFNFGSTLTDNTSWCGEQLEGYILKSFTDNKTVGSVPATQVITDIMEKEKVGKLDGSDLVQVGENCTFNDSGTVVVSVGDLEPKDLFINLQLCYEDLRPIYNTLNSGALNEQELSANFAGAMTDMLVSKFNQSWENMIWNATGGTGSTLADQIVGIDAQITTNSVSGATLTAANIIAALSALIAELPNDVLDKENLTIYMNQATLNLYYDALFALGIMTPQGTTAATYKGYPIVAISQIADNRMYAFETTNVFFGIGGMGDFEALQILDQKKITGDNAVRLILQARGDVLVGWESEASKYHN